MRHHPTTTSGGCATPATPVSDPIPPKKRGSYNCGRCGLPKKGHVCDSTPTTPNPPIPPRQPLSRLPRSLSFDNIDNDDGHDNPEFNAHEIVDGRLTAGCLWEVLKRLPPATLGLATGVCKGWRECTKRVWAAAEEVRIRFPASAQVGSVGSVLKKCSSLVRLNLRMESDVDATLLACIAFSCPNLESMEISTSETSINRISGDELSHFVADRRYLSNLKMEGCSNLGALALSSSRLSTLWLSDLHSLSKMVFNCPDLVEISLNFSDQESDATDLTTMVDNLGKGCPKLQNIHIVSSRLCHATVLALTATNLRALRMLSLVLGFGITDASVAAIASSYSELELLDLSGSSISDSGIGMVCNVFSSTLSRLLIALCPNITSSGIQFATAQLPCLELMDCGMTLCDPNSDSLCAEGCNGYDMQGTPSKSHHVYQKLIIKHSRIKKLSLWGCSSLDALYLSCPQLIDLNLSSCKNLHPERLLLECPNLEVLYASNCLDSLVGAIQSQTNNAPTEVHSLLRKRMADGSKRVGIPQLFNQPQASDDIEKHRVIKKRCIVIS